MNTETCKLRRHELAQRCGVTAATIDRWRKDGKIKAIPHPVGPGRGRVVWYDWRTVCRQLKIRPK